MVNSIYNGYRMEDVWLEKYPLHIEDNAADRRRLP
jgi:hypothetical protein